MKRILVRGARIYDPAQNARGEIGDLYLRDGKVSEPFADPEQVIEAEGRALMAGGIDPHCQLAAPGQALARVTGSARAGPEDLGERYAALGYVHVHQPLATLLTAGMVREALGRIPYVDKSIDVSVDLRDMAPCIRADDPPEFLRQAQALLRAAGALRLFLPFPFLRYAQRHYIHKNLSPARVLAFLARLDTVPGLRVTLWGMPGLLQHVIPDPRRFHIAGLAAALLSPQDLGRARELLDAGASADLGGGDEAGPVLVAHQAAVPPGTVSVDMGLHNPVQFRSPDPDTSRKATEMARALLLEARDSWHLSLSVSGPFGSGPPLPAGPLPWRSTTRDPSDRGVYPHPFPGRNGGPAPPEPMSRTSPLHGSPDLCLDPYEFARMTRVEPARALGLDDLGHLRPGARASVAIYDRPGEPDRGSPRAAAASEADPEPCHGAETPSHGGTAHAPAGCWCLIKDGVVVRENGRFTGTRPPVEIRRRDVEADLSACARTDLFVNPTLRVEHLGTGNERY